MKWKKRGHEYDELGDDLLKKWEGTHDIYLFGAGEKGKFYRNILEKSGVFSGFIDNRVVSDDGVIYDVDQFLTTKKNGWIVLCAEAANMSEMRLQLESDYRFSNKFYIYEFDVFFQEIYPVLAAYAINRVYDNLCQISVTERCTLKCEKCAHGCWNVPMANEDLSLDVVKESADNYFNAFDFVVEFVLIGGEPFLYKHIAESIAYIGDNYRNQIITFAITTNGTILPTQEVLDACKKYDVHIHISNYVKTLPALRERYKMLCRILEKNDISYELSNEDDKWVDYGFDSLVRSEEENLESVFDKCKTPCREVRGNKYYFCVQARAVGENMAFDVEDDYLDLSVIKNKEDKKTLMEFGMGYSKKGYLDMCKYCYGAEAAERVIPRAIQKRDM
ncbi:radical SAM protein [Butyrivibrio sp. FCS006]|uniref:radical SAM protein n=1 Tax=Butyrivibrio sp. FCS006 TaxID=1280684 RepID=UPI000422CF64|nr:radical SAM protein [Butyrivibrio sp. FCS006]